MKRMIAMVLLLCVLAVLIPVPARAWEIVDSGDWSEIGSDVRWKLDNYGVMTIYGTGDMYKNQFPSWDVYMDNIKAVVVEEGVTSISLEAFRSAKNLISVTIADSVTYIGGMAFYNCDSLTHVSLGKGLKKADYGVFADCDALTEFTFPDTDTEYGNQFLKNCTALKKVTLSDKITTISGDMFSGCVSLEKIKLPKNLKTIGGNAFAACVSLTEIVVPEGVTNIYDGAFSSCTNLKKISLPNSLTSMGSSVFSNCMSLTEVTVPVNVTKMGHTFETAYGLKSIKFLGNAPICGSHLFGNITVTVYYPDNNKTWTKTYRQNYEGTVTWKSYKSDIIPSDTVASGTFGESLNWKLTDTFRLVISGKGDMPNCQTGAPWADYDDLIESVIIEPGVTSIGASAFSGCRALQTVSISNTVTRLENSCFHNCVRIKEMVIPDSVHTIGYTTFYGCTSMRELIIPDSVTNMVRFNFGECGPMQIYYGGSEEQWAAFEIDLPEGVVVHYNKKIDGVQRIFGATRYDTAIAIAEQLKKNLGVSKFNAIVVASGTDFADALPGAYLANQKGAPVLLVRNRNQELTLVKNYIKANLAPGGTVYILGGEKAVPKAMETGLDGFNVKRLGGATRYETNLLILKEGGVKVGDDILVCTGKDFPDSLAASAVNKPILLVKDSLNASQTAFLNSVKGGELYIIGGTAAVNARIENALKTYGTTQRLSGATRYYTSVEIAKTFFPNTKKAVLAYGENFPDGMCGGTLAYSMGAPVLLTTNSKSAASVAYTTGNGIHSGAVLGGTTLISDMTVMKVFG